MSVAEGTLPAICMGRSLRRVELDLTEGGLRLVLDGGVVACAGVHSCNLLGPWDGTAGRVADLKVRRVDAFLFLEWRIEYPAVPRHYRVVCRAAEWRGTTEDAPPSTS